MKACIIQPYYSFDPKDTDMCFNEMVKLIKQCDASMDLIVIPEYADIPAAQDTKDGFYGSIEKYNKKIMDISVETAKRCNANVFVNAGYSVDGGKTYRNTTHAINRDGEIVGRYFKAHPAPSEVKTEAQGGNEMDVAYSYEYAKPYTIEIEGVRYGFMTCYDFYFYENFAPLALQNVDVIIGCSHQRTDTHQALDIINRFLCYNTNAYLVRSSVSLGEDSDICGCSCIISPDGTVLVDMKSRIGIATYDIDPAAKYYKAAGFRGAKKSHYEYIEEGRRPWLYRNGGSAIVPFEKNMPYPRLCAHRGFSTVAPENTMPAFGAAIASGADEIEFDLWVTKDGEIVTCHDHILDKISTGTGLVIDHTYAELCELDFGVKFDEKFKGLKIVTFEEILQKFAGHAIFNIHIKALTPDTPYKREDLEKIVALLDKYDCRKHVYFMTENDPFHELAKEVCPDIPRVCGHRGDKPWELVERAIEHECVGVQLFKPYFNQETVDKAHAAGLKCNVFWADDPDEAIEYLKMGIDCILTNDFLKVSNAVKEYLENK